MANQTIYPYGTNGQLPDSIGIINDLTTGGADKALSAEMGKELNMAIDNKGVSFKVEGDTLFIRTAASPMVNVLPTSIQFDDTIFGNTRTATVHIYGRNMTSQVEVQVSGVGFSGSAQLLPNGDGKVDADVTITFAPTANTGTEVEGGRSYEGSVTAVCESAESASATLEGFGVLTIMPRITASIDKAALKGVLDTTADGAYTSEPATATLHVQASNINQPLTLAVDNAKFSLSESQVSAEDAVRGKDITVTYLRQSAVTATDDECTITITATHDNTSVQSTVAVSGATAAKKTSGTIATIDGVRYFYYPGYESEGVYVEKSGSGPSGDLVIDSIFDAYGYKYNPHSANTAGFKNVTTITSLKLGNSVVTLYDNVFAGCTGLKHVEWNNLTASRNSMFSGCSNLETLEFVACNTFVSYTSAFSSCTKLKEVTIKSATKHGISYEGTFAPSETITVDGAEKKIYYYEDAQGNHQQKKLYVPSALVSSYQSDAIWGMFDVQPISE